MCKERCVAYPDIQMLNAVCIKGGIGVKTAYSMDGMVV